MNKVHRLLQLLEIRYETLIKTDISITKAELLLLKDHILSLEKENQGLREKLALSSAGAIDNKMGWVE